MMIVMTCLFREYPKKIIGQGTNGNFSLFIFSSLYIVKKSPSEPDWSHHVMRILIVEDEPLIALNTQADLEAAGHT